MIELDGLNSLHRATRAHFSQVGIRSVEQVAALTVEELCCFKHIGKVTAPAIHAQARAYLENCPVIFGPLPGMCGDPVWYFDIETSPHTGRVWSIGWGRNRDDMQVVVLDEHRRRNETLPLPDGRAVILASDGDEVWRVFADAVCADDQPVLHWTGFDAGVMRSTAPADVIERVDARLHDFHGSFKRAVQIPARGTSLKTVAAYFGFQWAAYTDWFMAWSDYRAWISSGNTAHLARACSYQLDDVRAMIVVAAWVAEQR
ncbi:MAG: ribonuclease H-like domain-containing protein [Chloroflexi bacterium]|nr:ribonuclease H-like domain-containing protein [Chloroflexota bacterium]